MFYGILNFGAYVRKIISTSFIFCKQDSRLRHLYKARFKMSLLFCFACMVACVNGQANTFTDVVSSPHMPSNFDGLSSADVAVAEIRYTILFGGKLFEMRQGDHEGQECQEGQYSDKVSTAARVVLEEY